MREHMIDEARIHYAITNERRCPKRSPVQSPSTLRHPRPEVAQVKELYNRVCNIAKGAALMTETTVEIRQVAAYSNLISSKILAAIEHLLGKTWPDSIYRAGICLRTKIPAVPLE